MLAEKQRGLACRRLLRHLMFQLDEEVLRKQGGAVRGCLSFDGRERDFVTEERQERTAAGEERPQPLSGFRRRSQARAFHALKA